jgi:hypothetical protein
LQGENGQNARKQLRQVTSDDVGLARKVDWAQNDRSKAKCNKTGPMEGERAEMKRMKKIVQRARNIM